MVKGHENGFGSVAGAKLQVQESKGSIGALDNSWLIASEILDWNPVCTGTYTFATKVTLDDLLPVVQRQVTIFPKYRQRLVDVGNPWRTAHFEEDPNFDLRSHFSVHRLPGIGSSRDELEHFTSEFIARDWDFTRPLWETVLLENYTDETGAKSAMMTRGHHTLADGQSFLMSQMYMTSFGPELEALLSDGAKKLRAARKGTIIPSELSRHLRPLDRFHNSPLLRTFMLLLYYSIVIISFIANIPYTLLQTIDTAFFFVLCSWRAEHVTPDYNGPRVKRREFSSSAAFPMSQVKRLQKAFSGASPGGLIDRFVGPERRGTTRWRHVTLNDVVVTIIADAIAEELVTKKPDMTTVGKQKSNFSRFLPSPISILVPISVRDPGDWSMRNLSTGAICYLPSTGNSPATPRELYSRVQRSKRKLTILKNSFMPRIAFSFLNNLGKIPILFPFPFAFYPKTPLNPLRHFSAWCLGLGMTSFCAVLTNVPGPPGKRKVEFAGAEVLRWTALPPQASKGTLGIGVISYADTICISIVADCVPGSEGVARRLTDGFERHWQQWLKTADTILTPSHSSSSTPSMSSSPPLEPSELRDKLKVD